MKRLTLVFVSIVFFAQHAAAEDCDITVRVVAGQGMGSQVEMNHFLGDMKDQLGALPYKEFKPLDEKRGSANYGEAKKFKITNGEGRLHELSVEPISRKRNRIKTKVDWTSPDGESLVSTQLQVVNSRNLVLGTDSSGAVPTILGITLRCR